MLIYIKETNILSYRDGDYIFPMGELNCDSGLVFYFDNFLIKPIPGNKTIYGNITDHRLTIQHILES